MDTDSSNESALPKLSELDKFNLRIKQQTTQFQSWLGRQTAALSDNISKSELARAHSLYLQETAEQSRFLISNAEESLAAELALSGMNAWNMLYAKVSSQLNLPFERDGKITQLPMSEIQNLALFDPDGDFHAPAPAWFV